MIGMNNAVYYSIIANSSNKADSASHVPFEGIPDWWLCMVFIGLTIVLFFMLFSLWKDSK